MTNPVGATPNGEARDAIWRATYAMVYASFVHGNLTGARQGFFAPAETAMLAWQAANEAVIEFDKLSATPGYGAPELPEAELPPSTGTFSTASTPAGAGPNGKKAIR